MGLTGFVIIHVFIAPFSPAQGERNQMVNAKFTRPVNAMPMSSGEGASDRAIHNRVVLEVSFSSRWRERERD